MLINLFHWILFTQSLPIGKDHVSDWKSYLFSTSAAICWNDDVITNTVYLLRRKICPCLSLPELLTL